MKAAQEIILLYNQELIVANRICDITELISALADHKKFSRIPRLLLQRQSLLVQFRDLESTATASGKKVFAQWHIVSSEDRASIAHLRDRIAGNLGKAKLTDGKITQLLKTALQETRDQLEKISPVHALHKKYSTEQDTDDPRYFRLSA